MMMTGDLTEKQQRFVDEYLIDLNATEAAKRAGYSEKSARSQGNRLLTNDDIAAAVQEGCKKRSQRTGITADRVIQEIARLAMSDPRRLFGENGRVLRPDEWDDDTAAMIAGVEVVTRRAPGADGDAPDVEYVHKYKIWDKNSALDKLMKHLGQYAPDVHEHTGKGGKALMPDVIQIIAPGHDDSED